MRLASPHSLLAHESLDEIQGIQRLHSVKHRSPYSVNSELAAHTRQGNDKTESVLILIPNKYFVFFSEHKTKHLYPHKNVVTTQKILKINENVSASQTYVKSIWLIKWHTKGGQSNSGRESKFDTQMQI